MAEEKSDCLAPSAFTTDGLWKKRPGELLWRELKNHLFGYGRGFHLLVSGLPLLGGWSSLFFTVTISKRLPPKTERDLHGFLPDPLLDWKRQMTFASKPGMFDNPILNPCQEEKEEAKTVR
jgi:hypothetical protein